MVLANWKDARMPGDDTSEKMKRKIYEKALRKLQEELCYLQDWIRT